MKIDWPEGPLQVEVITMCSSRCILAAKGNELGCH